MHTKTGPLRPFILSATIAMLLSAIDSRAALVTANESNNNNLWNLPVGSNLLVGAGTQPATVTVHEGSSASWGTVTDGVLGAPTQLSLSVTPNNNESVTFSLDLSGAAAGGYSLSSWDSYCSWQDGGRDNQNYTIQYATVADPTTFVTLATVANAGLFNSTHTKLTDSTGLLGVSNVGYIRINFAAGQENGYTGFREFIATGAISTPDITWTGASGAGGNATWISGADTNWKKTSDGSAQNYGSGGRLLFDSTGTNSNITVDAGGVSALGMAFTNDATTSYTVSGGSITTGAVSATGAGNVTINSTLIGNGGVFKSGAGTLTLTGTNTYSGVTTFEGGIVNVASLSNYGVPSSIGNRAMDSGQNVGLLFRGGTLQYTGATPQSTNRGIRISTVGGATIDASGSNPGATLSFTANTSADFFENGGSRSLTLTGSNTGNNTFAMNIMQTGGTTSVNKTGIGTWFLTGTGNYTGVTLLAGGILNAATLANYGVSSSIGARALGDDGATNIGILFRGGTLQYTGSVAQSTNRAIRVSTIGGATIDASGSTPEATLSFTAASSPDFFENGGNRQITFTGSNTGNNTFNMAIAQAVGLTSVTKNGPGTWVLSGANVYGGQTNINAGTLRITTNAGLGVGTFEVNTKTTIFDGATLELQGDLTVPEHFHFIGAGVGGNGAIRSLSGNSTLTQSSALDGNLRIGVDAGSLTISGQLYEENGSNELTKVGAGTLILNGPHIYTGATYVNAGTLLVNGSISNSTTVVNNGGTLGGSGTVGGLIAATGATVAPGNSPGILTAGNTAFATGSTLSLEIINTTPGTGYDQLAINGTLDLGSATLSLLGSYLTATNDIFYIILNNDVDAVSNTFAGLSEGSHLFAGNGQEYIISYRADSTFTTAGNFGTLQGNDVALMAVPEPSAVMSLLGGLGLLLGRRPRRQGESQVVPQAVTALKGR